ncbi:uncharacterized protein LOC117644990 isoform X2 [Thrips palmi]|nr:uncharacterized protein LOC117644990 isoform X2 [Thrips palmi]XP_034240751.1 uncharacterized protein LOC117644990 isoform X2 [Thrips palmi]
MASRLAELEVEAAEVTLRIQRLKLQAAEVAVDIAREQVELAELGRDHAVARRELLESKEPLDTSKDLTDASLKPSPPAAKKRKTASSSSTSSSYASTSNAFSSNASYSNASSSNASTSNAFSSNASDDVAALAEVQDRLAMLVAQELSAADDLESARALLKDVEQQVQQRRLVEDTSLRLTVQCSADEPSSEVGLDKLPDEGLLFVLSYLGPKELLECRRVCRRLRDMALHPDLWRYMWLKAHPEDNQLVAASLRLAPCLRWLNVGSSLHLAQLGVLLASTSCAIYELDLTFQPTDAVLVVIVLERQAALGRLKYVKLKLSCEEDPDEKKTCLFNLRLLLERLLHAQGLEGINLDVNAAAGQDYFKKTPALLNAAKYEVPRPAKLRALVHGTWFKSPYLPLQLKWNAATLEVVHFWAAPPRAVPLLCSLPRLRELHCPLLRDMPVLLQCAALKSLHLRVNQEPSTRHLFPGVQKYLRAAVTRLEDLTFEYIDDEARPEAVDLVLSLGGSAAPSLRSLSFKFTYKKEWKPKTSAPQLRPLATILRSLGSLVRLKVDVEPTDEFLEALDGVVLPKLGVLEFQFDDCPKLAHGKHRQVAGQLAGVLRRYPGLHLEWESFHEDKPHCPFCDQFECRDCDGEMHSLFTHPADEWCEPGHWDRAFHVSIE